MPRRRAANVTTAMRPHARLRPAALSGCRRARAGAGAAPAQATRPAVPATKDNWPSWLGPRPKMLPLPTRGEIAEAVDRLVLGGADPAEVGNEWLRRYGLDGFELMTNAWAARLDGAPVEAGE